MSLSSDEYAILLVGGSWLASASLFAVYAVGTYLERRKNSDSSNESLKDNSGLEKTVLKKN